MKSWKVKKQFWINLGTFGYFWVLLGTFECSWLHLATVGYFCLLLATFGSVMSMNIWILDYKNKMALKYYSYLYLRHFPSTNIFKYSFVDFWTNKYIRIFVRKFFKIKINLNICSEPYLNVSLSFLMKKVYLDIVYASKNIQCKVLFRGNMSEPF